MLGEGVQRDIITYSAIERMQFERVQRNIIIITYIWLCMDIQGMKQARGGHQT